VFIDAIGAAVNLGHTQEKKIHKTLVDPCAQQRGVDPSQSLCAFWRDGGIIEAHGCFLLLSAINESPDGNASDGQHSPFVARIDAPLRRN
jgi:hypothetical protein